MKAFLAAAMAVCLFACPSFADIPLSLDGDVVQVVQSLPFKVKAPVGKCVYFWSFPRDVDAIDQGDTLQITKAPKGRLVISVKCIQADWDAKKLITTFGSVTFMVGLSPSPNPQPDPEPDPEPQPGPVDPLLMLLREAYSMEPAATRAADLAALADLFGSAADVVNDVRLAKVYEVNQILTGARKKLIGERLAMVRGVLNAASDKHLPTDPQALLTTANRQLLLDTFRSYEAALRKVPQQ